jgi:hypothetical protein
VPIGVQESRILLIENVAMKEKIRRLESRLTAAGIA